MKVKIIFLFIFSFVIISCGESTEPIEAIETLEDYETVWCVINLRDINEVNLLVKRTNEIRNDTKTNEAVKDAKIRKEIDKFGGSAALDEAYELYESYNESVLISFKNSDTENMNIDEPIEIMKNLKSDEISDETISFCKTWYKVNN